MHDQNQLDALFLCRNARSFFNVPTRAGIIDSDQRLYFVAISIELSLKAYLRRAGMSDDETRKLVRHDLFKASRLAASLGLDLPEVSHAAVVRIIGPRYASGGFRRPPSIHWPPLFVGVASFNAFDLNERVSRCLAS